MSGDKSWLTKFRSMKTGLILVLVIIIASIAGTIIPQHSVYGLARPWYSLLQLNDVFHSWWYIALLISATLNLMACSFYRLMTIKGQGEKLKPLLESEQLEKFKYHTAFSLTGSAKDYGDRVINLLQRRGYETWSDDLLKSKWRIGAEQGRLSVWGPIITHLSFLVIMLGVLIGSIFGFQGSINAPVGLKFGLDSIPAAGVEKGTDGFELMVEEFWIERYADLTPAGYYSRLSIIEDGSVAQTTTIGVNSPLTYKGVRFYQASYGEAIEVRIDGPDGKMIRSGLILSGQRFSIPGTEYSVAASTSFSDAEKTAAETKSTSSSITQLDYVILKGNQHVGMGASGLGTPITIDEQGNTVRFVKTVPYTGLLVKKDPGIPLIWLGCFFLLIGMGISFFMKPHRLWVAMQQQGTRIEVTIGGITAKNQPMLDDNIRTISHEIQGMMTTAPRKLANKEVLLNGNI